MPTYTEVLRTEPYGWMVWRLRSKRRLVLAIALVVNLLAVPVSAAPGTVIFADSNLEDAVRDELGKPTGDITTGDMAGLWSLDLEDKEISDLSGLEHAVNLRWLSFWENQVSDISPLAGLINLQQLSIFGEWCCDNQVSDISPLAGLTNLQQLSLFHNQVSDISPLAGLTNLEWLSFLDNQVSDLNPLSDLTNLRGLSFEHNQVSDIRPLARLTNLEWVNFCSNRVSDLSPLSDLTNLQELSFEHNQVSDISPLVINSDAGGLGAGDDVDIRYNYLDLAPGSAAMTDIETLLARGVDVVYEPQQVFSPVWTLTLETEGQGQVTPFPGQHEYPGGTTTVLFVPPLLLALLAGAAAVWLGRRIKVVLGESDPERGYEPAVSLIRWRKRALLLAMAALLLTLLAGISQQVLLTPGRGAPRHGAISVRPLAAEVGGGWHVSGRARVEAALLETGLVGLRADADDRTHLYVLDPQGRVVLHQNLEQLPRWSGTGIRLEAWAAGLVVEFSVDWCSSPTTCHQAVHGWLLPRTAAGWGTPVALDADPGGEFQELRPVPTAVGEAFQRGEPVTMARTDVWRLAGYALGERERWVVGAGGRGQTFTEVDLTVLLLLRPGD